MSKIINKEALFKLFLISVLFFLYVYKIDECDIIYILGDEFGYWSNAAYIFGYDWSGVTSNNPYYSFGYSIILAPLFYIKDFTVRYKSALLVNAIFQVFSFYLLAEIGQYIFKEIERKKIMLVALVVSVYSSNIFQAKVTLSETFIYFLYVLTLYIVIKIEKTHKWFYYISLPLVLILCFAGHMRTIGILVGAICFFIIEGYKSNDNRVKSFVSFLIMVLLLFFCFEIKEIFVTDLYSSNPKVAINDFSGQVYKIEKIFSAEGIWLFVRSFLGKIWYLFASTFFVFAWFLIWGIEKVGKERGMYIEFIKRDAYFIFLIISVGATLGISAIYMLGESSIIDHLIYGRYNEFILGPVLLIGLCYLYKKGKSKHKEFFLSVIVFCGLTIFVMNEFNKFPNPSIREANIAGISYLAYNGEKCLYNEWELVIAVKVLLVSCFLMFLVNINKKKILYMMLVCIGLIWFKSGIFLVDRQMKYRESYHTNIEIAEYLEEMQIKEIIYVIKDKYESFDYLLPDVLQFIYPQINIKYIEEKFLNEEKTFFIIRNGKYNKENYEDYEYILSSKQFDLYRVKQK